MARKEVTHTVDGRTQTLTAWAAETGINAETIRSRINDGWSAVDVVTRPVGVPSERARASRDQWKAGGHGMFGCSCAGCLAGKAASVPRTKEERSRRMRRELEARRRRGLEPTWELAAYAEHQ